MIRRALLPFAALGVAACLPVACLPADSRPPPAQVFVSAEASVATRESFVTDDGWQIHVGKFTTALGNVDLDGVEDRDDGSCNGYSDTNYEWLFDFTVANPSKVAVVYGLGTCRVEYRFRGPGDDAVLGEGATEEDAAIMRTRVTNQFATDERTTLIARGTASRGDEHMVFAWDFQRSFEIERCGEDGALTNVLDLDGGEAHELRIEVRAEELFRARAADDGPLSFDLFAAADADGNAWITLQELAMVDAPADAAPAEVDENGEAIPPPESLADFLYRFSLPRVTRIQGGGPCRVEDR